MLLFFFFIAAVLVDVDHAMLTSLTEHVVGEKLLFFIFTVMTEKSVE